MKTLKQLERALETQKRIMERNAPIMNAEQQTPGPFVTGRSGYTMGKALDRENDRRAKAFAAYQTAAANVKWMEIRIAGVKAGEVHPNGQPCADAPSRQKQQSTQEMYADFMRSILIVGGEAGLALNPANTITVKRINKKTVTSDGDSKWTFWELLPVRDGKSVEGAELKAMISEWKESLN